MRFFVAKNAPQNDGSKSNCNGNCESQKLPPFAECAKDGAPGNSTATSNAPLKVAARYGKSKGAPKFEFNY
jgi:predicted lipoprotein with Yx(FWY)xxD motif